MMTEYDERVKDCWKLSGMNYIVETIDDLGLEDEVKKINTMPRHLGVFVLSNSKIIMNNFITRFLDFLQMMFIMQTPILCILRTNIGINWIKQG